MLEGVSRMTFYLRADLTFVCVDPTRDTDDDFDTFTDAVTDALYDLADVDEGIIDPDITVKITERWAGILMGITADTEADAVRLFSANVRAALHAAGCGTPDWPIFRPTNPVPEVQPADFTRT
ncbi:hypothetical protein SAMN05443665_103834 [Actinomadura meyerae]|uniref:Uncharacterized protein n=2 Tax=Actinomadura meyerae TaxID=240840 RepID=A0A239NA16_9ACTN|nr:hypothetical protein SAMN05443665_103834 [Actinomadura meyerae]